MARAKIVINSVDATSATVAIGSTVALSNDDGGGELTYAWSVVAQPEGTADALAATAIKNTSFVPTKEGSYELRLVVNALLASESVQTATVAVLDARTNERVPAATETSESSSSGWAISLNRILLRTLHASVDGNIVTALTPGGIAVGAIVKLSTMSTVNTGFQAQFDAPQIVAVDATASIPGRVGIVVDGVVPGVLTAGKLVQVRTFGLVPTAGSGSPAVGDPVYLSNAGLPALAAGTSPRIIGRVVLSAAGSYRWVIDGIASGVADNDYGDVIVSSGGTVWTVDTLPSSRISGLAAIATSGSASNLITGTVPAAQMPALTGDVTTPPGAVAATIAANAVTNSKAAQMAANTMKANLTGGTANATDATISAVLAALGVKLGNFGTGVDGAATMDGTTAVAGFTLSNPGASGIYTASREAFFTNLTINSGITCKPDGWPLWCSGTLTVNGVISSAGNAAAGTVGGAILWATSRPLPTGTAGGGNSGVAGGDSAQAPREFTTGRAAGGTTSGGVANAGAAGGIGQGGGGGGSGGTNGGAGNTGGASGLVSAATLNGSGGGDINGKRFATEAKNAANTPYTGSAGGGGGGGAGGGGGGGGGAGGGGGWIAIHAFLVAGSGSITAKGGAAGNGVAGSGAGGGGGGGGGPGGVIIIDTASPTVPTTDVTGGSAGTGGGATTGFFGGANGGAGGAGLLKVFN